MLGLDRRLTTHRAMASGRGCKPKGHSILKNTLKLLVALLVVFSVITLVVASSSAPAEANANGCTLAPGGPGALNCIYVDGSGQTVNYSDSIYNSGTIPANVCYPNGKWKYVQNGTTYNQWTYRSASTCGWWRGYITWGANMAMKDGSSFCATQKNSVISSYANYACITVHA